MVLLVPISIIESNKELKIESVKQGRKAFDTEAHLNDDLFGTLEL